MLCCNCGSRRFLRERPRQHVLGLEHGVAAGNPTIQSRPHPAQRRVTHLPLDVGDHLPGIGLVPAAVELLSRDPELDYEIAGQILRLDPAPLLPPQPDQRRFIISHDDAGIGAADEISADLRALFPHHFFHPFHRGHE
jgi:hypothetical protein